MPKPPATLQGPPPSMADMVVRAMRRPKEFWGDLRGVVASAGKDAEETLARMGAPSMPMSNRQRRLLGEAMGERMARFSKDERGRIAGTIEASRRFVLDDSFIAAVFPSMLGRDPERLAETIQLARLPFESVFVEMSKDDIARAVSLHQGGDPADPDEAGVRLGMLVERVDPEDPTQWIATLFRARNGQVTVVPFVSIVSTIGVPLDPPPPPYKPIPEGILPWDAPFVPLGVSEEVDGDTRFMAPSGYEESFGLAQTPLYMTALGDTIEVMREYGRLAPGPDRTLMKTLVNERFLLRFVLGVLATVNALPHTLLSVEARRTKGSGGRPLPLLPYDVITLRLGSEQGDAFDREIEAAAVREAHKVRGHWRTFRNADGTPRLRVWVKEHKRGTGPIRERDYAVTVDRSLPLPPMPFETVVPIEPDPPEDRQPESRDDPGFFGRLRRFLRAA